MVSGGVSTNHVGGAAQFLLCRNTTSRYSSPVELLDNITMMYPIIMWHQRYSGHRITPPNGLSRAPAPTASSGKIALLGAGAQLWSAMPIPHSSLLTPHLTGNSPFSTTSSAISLISSQSCE